MKKSINRGLLASSCLLLVGLAMTSNADDSTAGKESFEAAYQSAEKAREAAAAGFEWRDTGKTLTQSTELAEASDYEAAIKLVDRAEQVSDLAVMQAQTEAENWEQRAVK